MLKHSVAPHRRPARSRRAGLAAAALAAAGSLSLATLPAAQASEAASASAARYEVETKEVSRWSAVGFGGGTIYHPADGGEFGAVAVSPGFTASKSTLAWLGPRLAEQGFVVFIIDTNSVWDFPASRGDQLLAALDHLTQRSAVRDRVDADRLGVMGHSMGGGGSLEAVKDRPSLKAAIALTGWNMDKTWPEVSTPTLVVGAENDGIAPVASHSIPFYNGLPGGLDKAYLELNDAGHLAPNTSNDTIARYSIAWLKRFIDGDTGASDTLCPGPATGPEVSDYRSTCPF
ncbi:poly(ethylene terephthalate) hydrolase family protein [Streptomyces sp. O3]